MEQSLFTITCTTCQARLTVRSESAVGAILPCPMCGSMVEVAPPPDLASADGSAEAVASTAAVIPAAVIPIAATPAEREFAEVPVAGSVPPPLPAAWASPTELLWRKWLLLIGAPVAGLVIVVGVLSMFFAQDDSKPLEPLPEPVVASPTEPAPVEPAGPSYPTPEPASLRPDPRATAAAREADWANHRTNHQSILSALSGYQRAEGHFPAGAVGAALLPPETRLSWIATLLPYFDHRDWHDRLEFGYSWNGPRNRPISSRPLDPLVNPVLGPSQTEEGFPVTHYVGVAGVGTDAGSLKPSDPRVGVFGFGFGRTATTADITDGTSNTIAILGVSERLGPWAAGGEPTVRALTRRPYVNGPDGFGSGRPDGMLAGMADGAVRFISKDVDPRVLEQLVTIHGGGDATVAALEPGAIVREPERPPAELQRPRPKPKPPEPAPQQPAVAQDRPKPEPPAAGPAVVDVEARLAERIPEIDFRDVPLAKLVEFLSGLSTVRITFDTEAMARLGVAPDDRVTVRLANATVSEILESALSGRGLVYVVENGLVRVTSPENRHKSAR